MQLRQRSLSAQLTLGTGAHLGPQQQHRGVRTQARAPARKISGYRKGQRQEYPWRVFPAKERVEAIDLLTYELGQYPEQRLTTTTTTSSAATRAAAPTTSSPSPQLPPQLTARSAKLSKFASLDALSVKHASRPRGTGASAQPVSALMPSKGTRDVPTEAIHPFTPFREMEALVQRALADKDGDTHDTGKDGTTELDERHSSADRQERSRQRKAAREWARVTTHPAPLFSEERAVLHRFGMGGFISPTAPGFDGLFRQQWQDFHVTEIVADPTAPMGGVAVSRDLDYTIPPLPPDLLGHDAAEAHTSERRRQGGRDGPDTDKKDDGDDGDLPDPSFFTVDVAAQLAQWEEPEGSAAATSMAAITTTATTTKSTMGRHRTLLKELQDREAAVMKEVTDGQRHHTARFYLQCTLHKQHVAHSVALAAIAQTLRVHPRAISVAGIKDFIGDTVQRVRVENVSPTSALQANAIFSRNSSGSPRRRPHRPLKMTLSDFSYETAPLAPGDLFGNHFHIVLRDVTAPKADIQDALLAFEQHGFPNYYGCQRFSWFGGCDDAAFALLRHNWLAFAFRFLNFTRQERSLRELLQREKKYPHAVQDEYRRNVVRRLRQIAVEPSDLDEAPFQCCPPLNETSITGEGGGPLNKQQELILWQLREAYFDLHAQSRRLTAQRLSSYLWNQVLTLRLHHFGGERVLVGDHVVPAALRQAASTVWDRKEGHQSFRTVVTAGNEHTHTIADVVHPGFSFEGIQLPENPIGAYYEQVCGKYHLDWQARHTRAGIADFREPPRPIVRHPLNLSYSYDQDQRRLVVDFALERGCYANVAITELMKLTRCAGSEAVTVLPLADVQWDAMGERDPGYVTALQDIYQGYEDGVGFTGDSVEIGFEAESEKKVWDLDGPLFLPENEDPFRLAHKWGSRNLLRNSERRQQDRSAARRQLFEAPLARRMSEEELDSYAGHTVPLMPNARGKKTFFKVLRRNQRYAGAPRATPRVRRGAQKPNRSHKLPAFKTLNKDAWNVSW